MASANAVPERLSLYLLEQMTDGFSPQREIGSGAYGKVYLGVDKDEKAIAVKVLYDTPGHDDRLFDKEFHNLTILQHENIVQLVGYCHETMRECVPYDGRMVLAEVTKRALCLEYMQNGSLDKYLSDESEGHGWHTRYVIIKGICNGLKYLHEELKPPIYHLDLKPANVLLDENMVPKIADFGLSRLFGEEKTQITNSPIGTLGYLPPEFINRNIISNKLDIFSLGVVLIKVIAGPTGYSRSAEMSSEQFIDIVHGNWMSRLQAILGESYSEQVKRCIEIALSCVETDRHKRPTIGNIVNMLNETEAIVNIINESKKLENDQAPLVDQQMSSYMNRRTDEMIDVYPRKLHFSFGQNKSISCPVHVTNNMDDHYVAVRFVRTTREAESYYPNLRWLCDVLPPRSTHTFIVMMEEQQQQPENMDVLDIVVESCLGQAEIPFISDFLMRTREEKKSKFNKVRAVWATTLTRERITPEPAIVHGFTRLPIRQGVKIIFTVDDFGALTSMDVHPTEPWILASGNNGCVSIWNYKTQARVTMLTIMKQPELVGYVELPTCSTVSVSSVRFMVRKQLFLVGDWDGYIHVYTCMTMKKVKQFKAHENVVRSLAVHPIQPFLLSSSDDGLIKLWNWEKDWVCIQTFGDESGHPNTGTHRWVMQVKFNPHDINTFASVCIDRTAKVWSIFSPSPVATLDYGREQQVCVDFFAAGRGQQHYMVTGSWEGTARIWEWEAETCIKELKGLQQGYSNCNVGVINGLRDHPVLVTASREGSVSLCDSTTYRYEGMFNFGLGSVLSFAYIKSIRSLEDAVTVTSSDKERSFNTLSFFLILIRKGALVITKNNCSYGTPYCISSYCHLMASPVQRNLR